MKKKEMSNDTERIGEVKRYKGTFKLYRTPDPFPYVKGQLMPDGVSKFGRIDPIVELDTDGMYVGKGIFQISNGDQFLE